MLIEQLAARGRWLLAWLFPSKVWRIIRAGGMFLTCMAMAVNANTMTSTIRPGSSQVFSFGEPSSFWLANPTQKQTLLSIAAAEFSLQHLPEQDQLLLHEALGKSGIEVHDVCTVDKHISGSIAAFFRRYGQNEHMRFQPPKRVKNLLDGEASTAEALSWSEVKGDMTAYPYPISEEQVIPKVVPINLSKVQRIESSSTLTTYRSQPSALLYAKLDPKDRLIPLANYTVDFAVDPQTKRLTQQRVSLKDSQKVYMGIRIQEFNITYDFQTDPVVNRNVLQAVDHSMKGRIWWTFRPRLQLETKLSYPECNATPKSQSYLYESISAIKSL